MLEKELSHIGADGLPSMVDTSAKAVTKRVAKARSTVVLDDKIMQALEGDELQTPKGPVFQTAIIAGIMAAKRTGELIPLCHPLGLEHCDIKIRVGQNNEVIILCEASLSGKTGIEMEALTGASVAALTIYDMCKALSHNIVIKETLLIEKSGGKHDFKREEA